jgi:cell division septal protein FtsQ
MSDYAARIKAGDARASVASAPRRPERGAELGAEKGLVALLVAAALLALVAAAALVVPPALRVTRYEVSGNVSLTREELLSAALIHEKEYFFSLDPARVRAAIEAEPRVARAVVTKLFPNGLRIAVKERKAVAAALVSLDGRAAAVCIDAEGVAFAEATPEEAASVPVLSGIRFEGFRVGTKLPPVVADLVASLGEIQASEPALLSAVSEIRMVKASGGEPELLIYPLNQRIPVRAGASLDAPTLRSMILVLDVLGTRGIAASVQEIDFRTGTVVYRSKEGQSG